MSGGLRHHNDEETGRAVRWDTNHPQQDHYSHGRNQCVCAEERCARNYKIKKQKFLDTTGVVRDVEKLDISEIGANLGDRKCLAEQRKSFVEHPDAMQFLRISGQRGFSTRTAVYNSSPD